MFGAIQVTSRFSAGTGSCPITCVLGDTTAQPIPGGTISTTVAWSSTATISQRQGFALVFATTPAVPQLSVQFNDPPWAGGWTVSQPQVVNLGYSASTFGNIPFGTALFTWWSNDGGSVVNTAVTVSPAGCDVPSSLPSPACFFPLPPSRLVSSLFGVPGTVTADPAGLLVPGTPITMTTMSAPTSNLAAWLSNGSDTSAGGVEANWGNADGFSASLTLFAWVGSGSQTAGLVSQGTASAPHTQTYSLAVVPPDGAFPSPVPGGALPFTISPTTGDVGVAFPAGDGTHPGVPTFGPGSSLTWWGAVPFVPGTASGSGAPTLPSGTLPVMVLATNVTHAGDGEEFATATTYALGWRGSGELFTTALDPTMVSFDMAPGFVYALPGSPMASQPTAADYQWVFQAIPPQSQVKIPGEFLARCWDVQPYGCEVDATTGLDIMTSPPSCVFKSAEFAAGTSVCTDVSGPPSAAEILGAQQFLTQHCAIRYTDGACKQVDGADSSACSGWSHNNLADACDAACPLADAGAPGFSRALKLGYCATAAAANDPDCSCININTSTFQSPTYKNQTYPQFQRWFSQTFNTSSGAYLYPECWWQACTAAGGAIRLDSSVTAQACPDLVVQCVAEASASSFNTDDASLTIHIQNACGFGGSSGGTGSSASNSGSSAPCGPLDHLLANVKTRVLPPLNPALAGNGPGFGSGRPWLPFSGWSDPTFLLVAIPAIVTLVLAMALCILIAKHGLPARTHRRG